MPACSTMAATFVSAAGGQAAAAARASSDVACVRRQKRHRDLRNVAFLASQARPERGVDHQFDDVGRRERGDRDRARASVRRRDAWRNARGRSARPAWRSDNSAVSSHHCTCAGGGASRSRGRKRGRQEHSAAFGADGSGSGGSCARCRQRGSDSGRAASIPNGASPSKAASANVGSW